MPISGRRFENDYFARALRIRFPAGSASGAELRAFFENRVPANTVACWRLGRRRPPAWAIDLLQAEFRRLADSLNLQIHSRPGGPFAHIGGAALRRATYARITAAGGVKGPRPKTGRPRGPRPWHESEKD